MITTVDNINIDHRKVMVTDIIYETTIGNNNYPQSIMVIGPELADTINTIRGIIQTLLDIEDNLMLVVLIVHIIIIIVGK